MFGCRDDVHIVSTVVHIGNDGGLQRRDESRLYRYAVIPSPQGNPRAFAKFTMFFLDTIATFKENRNFAD